MSAEPASTIVPGTRSGRFGALVVLAGVVLFAAGLGLDAARSGPDPATVLNPLALSWLLILVGGAAELFAILHRAERAVLSWIALVPAAALLVLFALDLVVFE